MPDTADLPIQIRVRALLAARIATVIRASSVEKAIGCADALVAAGYRLIEVTMTVPGALEAIRTLSGRRAEGVFIGAGTVTTAAEARACVEAGADFVVSPICETDIIRPCRDAGVVAIPAGLTPTEIHRGWRMGGHFIKVFPAGSLGGPAYIKAVKGPLPDIPLWVSGMVTAKEGPDYFKAGVQLIGLGSELLPPKLVEANDWPAITEHARKLRLVCSGLQEA